MVFLTPFAKGWGHTKDIVITHYIPLFLLDSDSPCGGKIIGKGIKIPDKSKHSNNMDCAWTIQRDNDFILRFKSFDIELCDQCSCDYLRVGSFEKLCGKQMSFDIAVPKEANPIYLLFHSDDFVSSRFEFNIIDLNAKGEKYFLWRQHMIKPLLNLRKATSGTCMVGRGRATYPPWDLRNGNPEFHFGPVTD